MPSAFTVRAVDEFRVYPVEVESSVRVEVISPPGVLAVNLRLSASLSKLEDEDAVCLVSVAALV